MVFTTFALFAVLAVVAAAEPNQLRSLGTDCKTCDDSPCKKRKNVGKYFAHCDKVKGFVVCGVGGQCYERRCGPMTKWDYGVGEDGACVWKPSALGALEAAIPPLEIPATCGECDNPCSKEAIKKKKLFHAHCDKKKKYLQCAESGMCYEKRCPKNTIWDEDAVVCRWKVSALTALIEDPSLEIPDSCGGCENPCTKEAIGAGMYYHPHCTKNRRYLQCSQAGMCYETKCGTGTRWKQSAVSCVFPGSW